MIYLVSINPHTSEETHMEWPDQPSLEEAQNNFQILRASSWSMGQKPLDGYVYEADKPLYGHKSEKLDVAKFTDYLLNTKAPIPAIVNTTEYEVV